MKSILLLVLLLAVNAIKLKTKIKSKLKSKVTMHLSTRFFDKNAMKKLNIQYGETFWNETEMPQMKAHYPKTIK